ncbi:hypothetical protein PILCRDRAFT_260392 [Piloderma croceum F 1598]|uniref:Uncharacterized protein n=1 Tax=Piloderma croceum (strain F 1598) TaxID=765440 RepID=A0A0C3GAV7_PILCF|nr:hypothetical protein PILCRDRAFT_260392 [Piloderma croceum F 1598]
MPAALKKTIVRTKWTKLIFFGTVVNFPPSTTFLIAISAGATCFTIHDHLLSTGRLSTALRAHTMGCAI